MCEKSVKIGHFSHVFHMVFHIHTPSSERSHQISQVFGCLHNPFLLLGLFHHYSHEVFHILVYYSTPSFSELAFDTYPVLDYARKDKSQQISFTTSTVSTN